MIIKGTSYKAIVRKTYPGAFCTRSLSFGCFEVYTTASAGTVTLLARDSSAAKAWFRAQAAIVLDKCFAKRSAA